MDLQFNPCNPLFLLEKGEKHVSYLLDLIGGRFNDRDEIDSLRARRDPESYSRYRLYGLSDAAYQKMLADQGGVCAVCRRAESLEVDHDHDTGRVRALLCNGCNSALGFLNEDPLRARALASYIERQLVKELVS